MRAHRPSRPQTKGEEIANTVTHVVGSHLGAAMLALVVWAGAASGRDIAWKVTSGAIFGASIILLYAVSSAYHAVTNRKAKAVLHVMDHVAIYFLIAGSYTPFCLVTLRPESPALAWTIFGVEWGATFAGVLFKLKTTGRFRYVSTSAYVLMGWAALAAIVPLVRSLSGLGTMWLALGGGLYTAGCVFYLWKSLPYAHMIWHIFVLAGTICHFFCIFWHVMQ
ncbi:MAG: hemolysin III family protein [Kiritimatiellae bacterium]|nr:hemolysin III family protein [Kiritimatiellia bacterium]